MKRLTRMLLSFSVVLLAAGMSEAATPEETEPAVGVAVSPSPEILLRDARHLLADSDDAIIDADLRIENVRHGLSATHYRYRQWIQDRPVYGAELILTVDDRGRVLKHYLSLATPAPNLAPRLDLLQELRRHRPDLAEARIIERSSAYRNRSGVARSVERFVVEDAPYRSTTWEVDSVSGNVLSAIPSYLSVTGRVFAANPVTILNDGSLRDEDDAAAAVPDTAYAEAELHGLGIDGELTAQRVRIVDVDTPFTARARIEQGLFFDRGRDEFEEVNTYHHLDQSQLYLQSLGYVGTRQIIAGGVRADVHANRGADNSFFSATSAGPILLFGDGGVDDAEDPDIILHEYAHAIHDSLSPGVLFGSSASEGRAISEGFGDYWAFSSGYEASLGSGRDPYCIGDWDARCNGASCGYPRGTDCLRRVDLELRVDDFVTSNAPGTEHSNGRIWSTYLRDLFVSLVARHGSEEGKRRSDTIVLEALAGLPSQPRFEHLVANMIEASSLLYEAEDVATICTAARARKFPIPQPCREPLRGATLVLAGPGSFSVAPGSSLVQYLHLESVETIRRVIVQLDLDSGSTAGLRVSLVAPDGTRVLLEGSGSQIPPSVIFGRDRLPDEPFEPLEGRPNPGVWALEMELADESSAVTVTNWALLLEMEGAGKVVSREHVTGSRFIPAVAHTAGAAGTFFVTDLVIANPSGAHDLTLLFTPSEKDGTSTFSAVRVALSAGSSLILGDVVRSVFDAEGSGSLEIRGAAESVRISSRTYNRSASGTFGQTIPVTRETAGPGERLLLPLVRQSMRYRTNFGLAESSGSPGEATVSVRDGSGAIVGSLVVSLAPFTHRQIPLTSFVSTFELDPGWAEVEVSGPQGAVSAYTSIVDNRTGDSIFVSGTPVSAARRALALPVAAHVPGALGTRWKTDVWIVNGSEENEPVPLTFHRSDGTMMVEHTVITPGSSRFLGDVIGELFGTEGSGWLSVGESKLTVSSRTWNDDPAGTYGQSIGAVTLDDTLTAGQSALVPHVVMTNAYRTNVGVTELAGGFASLRLDVRDGSGAIRCSLPFELGANQHRQLSVAEIGCGSIGGGRIEFHHLEGAGRIVGYASIVDQKTGDPSYIAAE